MEERDDAEFWINEATVMSNAESQAQPIAADIARTRNKNKGM